MHHRARFFGTEGPRRPRDGWIFCFVENLCKSFDLMGFSDNYS